MEGPALESLIEDIRRLIRETEDRIATRRHLLARPAPCRATAAPEVGLILLWSHHASLVELRCFLGLLEEARD